MPKVSRLEVLQTGARRRWTLEAKRRIVAESHDGRRQVSATARRHGLSASQLFTWRRLAREGRLGAHDEAVTFAQAVIARDAALSSLPSFPECFRGAENRSCQSPGAVMQGRMEIVLGGGQRVIVDKEVDAGALARVVGVLDRR
jgi:transposase